jgi:hypothetical protein
MIKHSMTFHFRTIELPNYPPPLSGDKPYREAGALSNPFLPDHQITRSPDHQFTRSPDHQITRSTDHVKQVYGRAGARPYQIFELSNPFLPDHQITSSPAALGRITSSPAAFGRITRSLLLFFLFFFIFCRKTSSLPFILENR